MAVAVATMCKFIKGSRRVRFCHETGMDNTASNWSTEINCLRPRIYNKTSMATCFVPQQPIAFTFVCVGRFDKTYDFRLSFDSNEVPSRLLYWDKIVTSPIDDQSGQKLHTNTAALGGFSRHFHTNVLDTWTEIRKISVSSDAMTVSRAIIFYGNVSYPRQYCIISGYMQEVAFNGILQ